MMKRFAILLDWSWTQTNSNLFGHQHPRPQLRGTKFDDHSESITHSRAWCVISNYGNKAAKAAHPCTIRVLGM